MTAYGNRLLYAPRLHAARDGRVASGMPGPIVGDPGSADREPHRRPDRARIAPFASEVALGRVHTQAHIDYIRSMTPVDGYVEIDPDTLMNRDTWRAALRAAGAAIAATDAVIEGRYANAFCSVRPPGHHAEPARAMGFASSTTWRSPRGTRSTSTASNASRSSISTCIMATAPKRRSRTTSAC
jgi:hypothetical protein